MIPITTTSLGIVSRCNDAECIDIKSNAGNCELELTERFYLRTDVRRINTLIRLQQVSPDREAGLQ